MAILFLMAFMEDFDARLPIPYTHACLVRLGRSFRLLESSANQVGYMAQHVHRFAGHDSPSCSAMFVPPGEDNRQLRLPGSFRWSWGELGYKCVFDVSAVAFLHGKLSAANIKAGVGGSYSPWLRFQKTGRGVFAGSRPPAALGLSVPLSARSAIWSFLS